MKKSSVALFAAAAVAASSASAADLGRPAPAAVDYVKVCDAYGEGFFYIPGTQTCLKVGGYVRAEYRVYDFDKAFGEIYGSNVGTSYRSDHNLTTRARAALMFDARTNTEFGLLRSYAELYYTVDSGSSSVTTTVQKAYIQWGGLTAGRAQSFFDFYTGDHYSSYFETAHSDSIVNLLGYTFSFGNGISATLSIEDPSTGAAARRMSYFGGDGSTTNPYNEYNYGGVKYPDLVGNVNISQAWGSAQVMAALHQDYPRFKAPGSDERWGYAVGAGVTVKLPMLGAGDALSLQAAYSDGAISYVTPDPIMGQDFGYGDPFAIFFDGKRPKLAGSKAWSVAAGLTHNWSDKWSSAATVSYADIDHAFGKKWYDYSQVDAGVNLVWAPTAGLTIGAEVEYKSVSFDRSRGTYAGGEIIARQKALDTDAIVGLLRIQRSF